MENKNKFNDLSKVPVMVVLSKIKVKKMRHKAGEIFLGKNIFND